MRNYNYFQAIPLSFYSRDLYRDIAKNWGGGVVLYLFILLAICWAALVFKVQPVVNTKFIEIANKLGPQVPTIDIKKGEATTPKNKPYIIKDPDTDEVVAIIDTSNKYTDLCITEECAKISTSKTLPPETTRVLITKNRIFYTDGPNTVKIQQIPQSLTVLIEPQQVKEKLVKFVGWAWVIFFPILLLFSFAYRLVQALLYAILGKIFAALSSVRLSYSEVLKLSMVAVTPTIIINTILDWFNISFYFELLFYFLLTMAYLIFAVIANKNTTEITEGKN